MKYLLVTLFLFVGLTFAQIPAPVTSGTTVENMVAAINNGHTWLEAEKLTYLGAYSAGTTYAKSAVVSSSGIWYVSLQGSNTGNTPASSGAYWVPVPGSGGSGGSGGLVRDYQLAVCQAGAGSLSQSVASTTPAAPTPDCFIGTNGVIYGVAKFTDASTQSIQGSFKLPSSLTSIAVSIEWETAVTNTALAAVWQVRGGCLANNEAGDLTFNTAQTVTSNAIGTARHQIFAAISTATITGCAASERYHWELYRDPAHASDNLAATAEVKAITFSVQ